jgi:hypothetical protein
MIHNYSFKVNRKSRIFCDKIVSRMVNLFEISVSEAVGRINRQWNGDDFLAKDDLRYHETVEFWVNTIYYGPGSYWWTQPPDLKPLPFP